MRSLQKILILTIFTTILNITNANAGVYFLEKAGDLFTKPNTPRTCEQRGYPLTIENCGENEVGKTYCPNEHPKEHFRKCVCPSKYKYKTSSDCEKTNQSPTGEKCKDLFDSCECNKNKYNIKYEGQETNISATACQAPKVPNNDTCTYNDPATGTLASGCICPAEYTKVCSYPYGPDETGLCNEKARKCVCDSKFSKTCAEHGSKPQYGCTDPSTNIVRYSICNDELPQVKIFVVDGLKTNNTSCTDTSTNQGLQGATVTFSKQGESDVIAKTDHKGEASIPYPYDIRNGKVTVTIEKKREEKYDGTDLQEKDWIKIVDSCDVINGDYSCNGNLYPLSPKNWNEDDQNIRVITSWGSLKWPNTPKEKYNIRDLDAHLLRSDKIHTWYSCQGKNIGGITLDTDDTNCYGPETITFPSSQILTDNKDFYFSVLLWGTPTLEKDTYSKSSATVYLYVKGELKRIFRIKDSNNALNPGQTGTVWNVFKIYKSGSTIRIDSSGAGQHGKIRDINTGKYGQYKLRGCTGDVDDCNKGCVGTTSQNYGNALKAHGW